MQILLVDGNFFCYRLMHYGDILFKENLEQDRDEFFKMCTTSLINEIENIPTTIDHIIFASDFDSWRKGITMEFPKHYDDELKVSYKYNREITEHLYNKEQLYIAMNDWFLKLRDKFNIGYVKTRGAESDDIVAVLANAFSNNEKLKDNVHIICWTSDGDYPQLVNDKISIMKLPNKTLITNKTKRVASPMAIFGNKKPSLKKNTIGRYLAKVQNGVKEVHPQLILLNKIVGGDKKDNVPPILMWGSTTGTSVFKPSEKMVDEVLTKMNISPFDLTNEIIFGDEFIDEFISILYDTSGAYKENPSFHPKMTKLIREKLISGEPLDEKDNKKIEKLENYNIAQFSAYSPNKKYQLIQAKNIYKQNITLKALDVNVIPKNIVSDILTDFRDNNKKLSKLKPFYEQSMNDVFDIMGLKMSDKKVFSSNFDHLAK